jgi:hypothetical protein
MDDVAHSNPIANSATDTTIARPRKTHIAKFIVVILIYNIYV